MSGIGFGGLDTESPFTSGTLLSDSMLQSNFSPLPPLTSGGEGKPSVHTFGNAPEGKKASAGVGMIQGLIGGKGPGGGLGTEGGGGGGKSGGGIMDMLKGMMGKSGGAGGGAAPAAAGAGDAAALDGAAGGAGAAAGGEMAAGGEGLGLLAMLA